MQRLLTNACDFGLTRANRARILGKDPKAGAAADNPFAAFTNWRCPHFARVERQ